MPNPFIKFQSTEDALTHLYRRVLGVDLIFQSPTEAAPTDVQYLTEQRDRYLRCSQGLEKQNTELEMKWLEAAADASVLREEVKRLTEQRDKCQAGNRERDEEVKRLTEQRDGHHHNVAAYAEFTRNVATALGLVPLEVSFDKVLHRIGELKATPTYRMLDVGEALREGDEVNLGSSGWTSYGAVGSRIGPKGDNYPVGYYRRRITPA